MANGLAAPHGRFGSLSFPTGFPNANTHTLLDYRSERWKITSAVQCRRACAMEERLHASSRYADRQSHRAYTAVAKLCAASRGAKTGCGASLRREKDQRV